MTQISDQQTPDQQTPVPPTPEVLLAVRNRRRLIGNIPTMLVFLAVMEGVIFGQGVLFGSGTKISGTDLELPMFLKVIAGLMPPLVVAAAVFMGTQFQRRRGDRMGSPPERKELVINQPVSAGISTYQRLRPAHLANWTRPLGDHLRTARPRRQQSARPGVPGAVRQTTQQGHEPPGRQVRYAGR